MEVPNMKEIKEQIRAADAAFLLGIENGASRSPLSYECGVAVALRWVAGLDPQPPMEDRLCHTSK